MLHNEGIKKMIYVTVEPKHKSDISGRWGYQQTMTRWTEIQSKIVMSLYTWPWRQALPSSKKGTRRLVRVAELAVGCSRMGLEEGFVLGAATA